MWTLVVRIQQKYNNGTVKAELVTETFFNVRDEKEGMLLREIFERDGGGTVTPLRLEEDNVCVKEFHL